MTKACLINIIRLSEKNVDFKMINVTSKIAVFESGVQKEKKSTHIFMKMFSYFL